MGIIAAAKLLLKGKKSLGIIKSVKPFSKTGAKTISEIKAAASAAKLKIAQFNLKESFKKVDKTLDKLKNTVKKQKKILDD